MDESEGTHYLLIRRPDGSFVRATDQARIDAAIAAGGELFTLYRKAPNPAAYSAVMVQGFGKPKKEEDALERGRRDRAPSENEMVVRALCERADTVGPLEIRVKTLS